MVASPTSTEVMSLVTELPTLVARIMSSAIGTTALVIRPLALVARMVSPMVKQPASVVRMEAPATRPLVLVVEMVASGCQNQLLEWKLQSSNPSASP